MTTATATWVNREATAEELIPLIGKLHRENGVVQLTDEGDQLLCCLALIHN